MVVGDKSYQTVWMEGSSVFMIEQNLLPFEFKIHECKTYFRFSDVGVLLRCSCRVRCDDPTNAEVATT